MEFLCGVNGINKLPMVFLGWALAQVLGYLDSGLGLSPNGVCGDQMGLLLWSLPWSLSDEITQFSSAMFTYQPDVGQYMLAIMEDEELGDGRPILEPLKDE